MTTSGPVLLAQSVRLLETHGCVRLAGAYSGATARWVKRRRAIIPVSLAVGAVGLLLIIAGILLARSGAWILLVPLGGFLCFVGVLNAGVLALHVHAYRGRLEAELGPVVIDARGIVARGVGPIPWGHLGAPEWRRVWTRMDIGGICTVMPLTPEGFARVNEQPSWWRTRIGPQPYLAFNIPYLLLPGVAGLSEEEGLQLFAAAHRRFAR